MSVYWLRAVVVLFDMRASEVIFFVLHEGMWIRPDVCLRSICHRTRLFIKHGLITTPLLFFVFFPLSCVPRTDWKLLQTRRRSWDLMRREDSSVIALNPDAGDAFQVIRPWALRLMLMEGRVCLERPWGSLLSWIAYIGARGYLEKSSIIWAAVQVTACHWALGSWDRERESRDGVLNSVVFRVVVIMVMSNNWDKWAPLSNALFSSHSARWCTSRHMEVLMTKITDQ